MMRFFRSATEPSDIRQIVYYFIFSGNSILVKSLPEERLMIPAGGKEIIESLHLCRVVFLGNLENRACYCAALESKTAPEGYFWLNLRKLYGRVDESFWRIAGYGRQIYDWNVNFQFCGRCGSKTAIDLKEHVRLCPECGLTSYPRISPAIITAVVKENKILLARGRNFPDKKMFSVLAGFVAPGETLEACIQREIYEEVGIRVKRIRYFKSQPWPFPDSLMIGFTAVHDKGCITIDQNEIVEAGWFSADALPLTPGKQSLAGELIEWFVNEQ